MPVQSRFGFSLRVFALCAVLAPFAAGAAGPAPDPLRSDALGATLAGEYARQAGRLDEAIGWYMDAARAAGDDPALAEQATRLALLGNDDAVARQALAMWQARAEPDAGMRAAIAILDLRAGQLRKAQAGLSTLLAEPGGAGWRHVLAVLAAARDQAAAARLLGRLAESHAMPAELTPWLAFSDLARRMGQPRVFERIFQGMVKRFPDEPGVALLRATRLREAGDEAAATAVLAAIGDAGQLGPELRYAIASEYDALGDQRSAERLLAIGPQDARSFILRASLLARAGDKQALGTLYDEVKLRAGNPNPGQRLLLGQMAEYLERNSEALEWYQSVPGGNERWQAQARAAVVLHGLGRGDEAWEALLALQSEPAASEELRVAAHLLEGELRAKDGDGEGEYQAYTRALGAYPDDASLLYARALMWERRDDIARAEADLRKILVADPENVATLNALGYTLADRTDRYEEALELIDRARVAEPDNPAIIDSYGWVLHRLGRHREALVELRRAYTLQPDAEIAAHVAQVLWVLGRTEEARRYFDEARKLDPDNRSLQRALERTGA